MTTQRYFEDVNIGDELEPVEKMPTEELCVDFFTRPGKPKPKPERIPSASAGYGDVLVPGLLKMAWLSQYVSQWAGPEGRFRTVRASYRRPDATGSPLTLTGTVVDKRQVDGRNIVEIEVMTVAAEGPSVRGTAQVELPSRT